MQNIGNGTIPHVQESQPQGPVDLAALANALVTLQTKVATLETRSSQMDELLAKLDILSKENEAQRKFSKHVYSSIVSFYLKNKKKTLQVNCKFLIMNEKKMVAARYPKNGIKTGLFLLPLYPLSATSL
jgi:hypothetical protein